MKNITAHLSFLFFLLLFFWGKNFNAQQIPIINYSININGQTQLNVNSTEQNYYVTKIKHQADSLFLQPTTLTLGKANSTVITEAAQHYPVEQYQVLEYEIEKAFDTDEDGIDDITEYYNAPLQSPFNAALSISVENGLTMVNSFATFKQLSIKKDTVQWSEFLNGKEYVKFIINDLNKPLLYFINSKTHNFHSDFTKAVNIEIAGDFIKKGQIIFHPSIISHNGTLGIFAFNYSNGKPQYFKIVQATYELLIANMPFLKNNLSYYVTANSKTQFKQDELLYQQSRVPILFEEDVYEDISFQGLNQGEGLGFLRLMPLEEIPGPRDIVLYEALPNTLPRVGGIITTAIQTPLSHVNLRAIQNNIPNAYIKNALNIDAIKNLLNNYVYFKVEKDSYEIRAASLQEVNTWYENTRPTEAQHPPLNLAYTKILPLKEIDFFMSDAFGAKCANLATMHTFGFNNETIPNGFGIPFYYYQKFMKYNNFFELVSEMIGQEEFKTDRNTRDELLKDFRKEIKNAVMPNWMLNDLAAMHATFPKGTAIRCRSSSNNEDIPGFNGAGLYDSKTQHPDEGHISKSIKQVYASLWNLRAFEEREFYKINHFLAAMGVLCHPNFSNEKANGVAISDDPFYNTDNTFYLNTQIGEDLITNPETSSVPEEILLHNDFNNEVRFSVLQYSNLAQLETTILNKQHLKELRDYLFIIDNEFKQLYNVGANDKFAIDIEYKINNTNQLVIKQARPWISYNFTENEAYINRDVFNLIVTPNLARKKIIVQCQFCNINKIVISNIAGHQIGLTHLLENPIINFELYIENLAPGVYFLSSFTENEKHYETVKFIKQ